jgi:hypothetical protein
VSLRSGGEKGKGDEPEAEDEDEDLRTTVDGCAEQIVVLEKE